MLHPFTRRFIDPATEYRYREAMIDADRRDARLTALVMMVPVLGFGLADLAFVAAEAVPLGLLLTRIGMIAITMAMIARLRWHMGPAAFDLMIGLWWMLLAVFMVYVNSTRPTGYLLHNALDTAVAMICFVLPLIALPLQFCAPLLLAAGNLIEANSVQDLTGDVPRVVLPMTYCVVLGVGYTVARRQHGMRRAQWAAMEQRLAAQRQLESLARTDALTGLLNRRQFMNDAEAEVQRAKQHGRPLGVLIADLDHFKRINDSLGHQAGDAALVAVAAALSAELRAGDRIGRLGGEEFALVLTETPPVEVFRVAERLREACAGLSWNPDAPAARVTLSIGAASLDSNDTGIADVLRRADKALYEAKHAGRNRVVTR